jgi:hypothetical protein
MTNLNAPADPARTAVLGARSLLRLRHAVDRGVAIGASGPEFVECLGDDIIPTGQVSGLTHYPA